MKHNHYKKDVSHLSFIDVYRVCQLFDVKDPCLQHAVKKVLCAGQRLAKGEAQDIQEAIDTLVRHQDMRQEDSAAIRQTAVLAWPEITPGKVHYQFMEETNEQ